MIVETKNQKEVLREIQKALSEDYDKKLEESFVVTDETLEITFIRDSNNIGLEFDQSHPLYFAKEKAEMIKGCFPVFKDGNRVELICMPYYEFLTKKAIKLREL